jgi:hypothetical protein
MSVGYRSWIQAADVLTFEPDGMLLCGVRRAPSADHVLLGRKVFIVSLLLVW